MTLIVDTPHYARFSCPKGEAMFSLSLNNNDFSNGVVIYFECRNLETWAGDNRLNPLWKVKS